MAKKVQNVSDALRKAIDGSGMSRQAICEACGIDRGTMSRFMTGRVGLSLPTIDRLAGFLGLELLKQKTRKGR